MLGKSTIIAYTTHMNDTPYTYNLTVLATANERLDAFLASCFPEFSRGMITSWIKSEQVTVNQKQQTKPSYKVQPRDHLTLTILVTPQQPQWEPEAIPLSVLFEDNDILVINKPAGLTVHPGAGQHSHTLANALHYYCPSQNHLPRMGIVHRLDKDTSGVMVVAKSLEAHTNLIHQLQERTVSRTYHTIVLGHLIAGGTIDQPVGRDPRRRIAMAINPQGKPAITHYRVLEKFDRFTLLQVNLETGRTHQIRVHMSAIKHPIIGDKTYGKPYEQLHPNRTIQSSIQTLNRQALHAAELAFSHPITQKPLHFCCPYPEDFAQLLSLLQKEHPYADRT